MNAKEDLILKAASMAVSESHQEWKEFLSAFGNYAETIKNECVSSPLDALQVNQGRARNCMELVRLFEDAVNSADRIRRQAGK